MRAYPDPVETLRNPDIRKFFIPILESNAQAEEKYEAFIRFFEIEKELSQKLQAQVAGLEKNPEKTIESALEDAARSVDAWQPELILERTRDSLERALRRIERSQHVDGGWGYEVQWSHPWATAWTVLCLYKAANLAQDGSLVGLGASPDLVERGLRWLIEHRGRWSVYAGDNPTDEGRSVYETAVVLRCLYKIKAAERPEVKRSAEGCIECLLRNQKPEGDWDSTIWSRKLPQPGVSRREVGATSFALQALAATRHQDKGPAEEVKKAVRKGVEWLRRTQNQDGSWNASVYPPHTPVPVPSVNKTCDALKGFLAGKHLGIDLEPNQGGVDRAVKWLLDQEQAVIGEDGKIKGWGWQDVAGGPEQTQERTEHDLLENTCLTLETLLEIESVGLPLLASNALWLIRRQLRASGKDNGKWSNNDTGRIAFALLEFYCRAKDSPIFQPAQEATA